MAEKRMFSIKILESDAFMEMPPSAQMLYVHLCMNADDDGFVNNPKKIQRSCGSSEDDLKMLEDNRFIIVFPSKIIVIKHWRIHNYIPPDRYKPSCYEDEKIQIGLKANGSYTTDKDKIVSPVTGNPKRKSDKKKRNNSQLKNQNEYNFEKLEEELREN